jgi:RNA-splicing ligase RtcB
MRIIEWTIERPSEALCVRAYADEYLGSRLIGSELPERLSRLALAPGVSGPIELYPDVTIKTAGFPAGMAACFGSDPYIYPLAAPDLGCGYDVVALGRLGAEAGELTSDDFDGLVRSIAIGSPDRVRLALDIRSAMRTGLDDVNASLYSYEYAVPEGGNSWPASVDEFSPQAFERIADRLGSAAGHFVSVYSVESILDERAAAVIDKDELVVVVHIGSAPVRDLLASTLLPELAEASISRYGVEPDLVMCGMFGVPLASDHARRFLGAAMAARNFGWINRHAVAQTVVTQLERAGRPGRSIPRLLRHVDHVAFEQDEHAKVITRRGVQPLHHDSPLTFVTGGEHTHAYLCLAGLEVGSFGARCGHGTPMWRHDEVPSRAFDLHTPIDIEKARAWTAAMFTNRSVDWAQWTSDISNLELLITYMEEAKMATRAARLKPIMNYHELRL